MTMTMYGVKFAGNDLSLLPNVTLYWHNFNSLPTREIKINKLARRDKSIITSSDYSQKQIIVRMDICSGNRYATEQTVTQVKALLQPVNQPLVVMQNGVEVNYTATMNQFNIEWNGPNAYCELMFLASDPIGESSEFTTVLNRAGITASTIYETIIFGGSSTLYPVITVAINSVTDGSDKSIIINNAGTNQGISINADWSNGDLLIIDSDKMTVTINGLITDFTGMFPEFSAGSQQISYIDDFTTRNVDLTVTYKPRYV